MTTLHIIEWLAALLTINGAYLLASNKRNAAWGWVLLLGANVLWILFAWITSAMGLMTQQLVLTATSLLGIWRGLVVPRLDGAIERIYRDTKL